MFTINFCREPLRKPLTCLQGRSSKKDALALFRLVQIYMGDRRAKPGMTLNSVAREVTWRGLASAPLKDEILVQLCKQTTDNADTGQRESLRRGWELMAICLAFFSPSPAFTPPLAAYIAKHRDPSLEDRYPDVGRWPVHVQVSHYAGVCARRLERGMASAKQQRTAAPTAEEIERARSQIFRPTAFGGTIVEALEAQRRRFPGRRIPWALTTLAEQVRRNVFVTDKTCVFTTRSCSLGCGTWWYPHRGNLPRTRGP